MVAPTYLLVERLDLVLAGGLARGRGGLEHLDDGGGLLLELLERILRLLERRLQVLELLGGAVLLGVGGAARAQVVLDELLERRQVAPALVVLALLVGRVEILDRRVAPNAVLVAERLAGRRAVNVSDEDLRGIRALSQGVPIGLHLLAVASPRRKELDKRGLARLQDLLIKVVGRELGRGRSRADERAEERDASHPKKRL